MDGVLVDSVSSWVLVHEHFGTNNEDGVRMFLDGLIDDEAFIMSDVVKWTRANGGPVHIDQVREVLLNAPYMDGVLETFGAMKEAGWQVFIVSGGIDILCQRILDDTGIDGFRTNRFLVDEQGYLTGEAEIGVFLRRKDLALESLLGELGVFVVEGEKGTVDLAVGDTFIDTQLFRYATTGVAFNPRDDEVVDAAEHVIREKDLRLILPLIGLGK